jgi:hypothetical protein
MREKLNGKIILVVTDPIREKLFLKALNEHGVLCSVACSLTEAVTHASSELHCGIVVDMKLMIKKPASKNDAVNDLFNGLPCATVNIHEPSGDIRLLSQGKIAWGCSSLDQFISICAQFTPKIILRKKRAPIHYNVLFDRNPDFSSPFRSVCIDISDGGCFLFYGNNDIASGDAVWIKGSDTACNVPIKATVCWVREWGTSQCIPGFGVCIETQHQTEFTQQFRIVSQNT